MSAAKSHVVSVRVEPHIKAALQAAAERELRSVTNMLEVIVVEYCKRNAIQLDPAPKTGGGA